MIVLIVVTAATVTVTVIAVFCSKCNSDNSNSNLARSIYDKFVGNGSVMDNYVGCDSSCNSYNIG